MAGGNGVPLVVQRVGITRGFLGRGLYSTMQVNTIREGVLNGQGYIEITMGHYEKTRGRLLATILYRYFTGICNTSCIIFVMYGEGLRELARDLGPYGIGGHVRFVVNGGPFGYLWVTRVLFVGDGLFAYCLLRSIWDLFATI